MSGAAQEASARKGPQGNMVTPTPSALCENGGGVNQCGWEAQSDTGLGWEHDSWVRVMG